MIGVPNLRDLAEVEALKRLALLGASRDSISLSSSTLASILGTSMQTAARRLCNLEEDGYLARKLTNIGQDVKITEKGILRLKAEREDYKKIFQVSYARKIKGTVASGMGEGQYYISLDGYTIQFNQKLGFIPYPGTLNLRSQEPFVTDTAGAVKIDGFKDERRTYGACQCYPAEIGGVECAIIRPERSSYPSHLLEIISSVELRKALSLSDGNEVEVILR
jgi:riboflavin kinase